MPNSLPRGRPATVTSPHAGPTPSKITESVSPPCTLAPTLHGQFTLSVILTASRPGDRVRSLRVPGQQWRRWGRGPSRKATPNDDHGPASRSRRVPDPVVSPANDLTTATGTARFTMIVVGVRSRAEQQPPWSEGRLRQNLLSQGALRSTRRRPARETATAQSGGGDDGPRRKRHDHDPAKRPKRTTATRSPPSNDARDPVKSPRAAG